MRKAFNYSFYRILKELVQLLSPTVNYCHACKGLCQSIGATQSRLLPCALEISQFSKKKLMIMICNKDIWDICLFFAAFFCLRSIAELLS